MNTNVNEMLAGRQSTYGAFENHAKISQALKAKSSQQYHANYF